MEMVVPQSQDLVSADLAAETVLMGLDQGYYYGLGDTGSRIWELVREPMTVTEVWDRMVAEYNVEPERCRVDLLRFLNALMEERLVEVVQEGSSGP